MAALRSLCSKRLIQIIHFGFAVSLLTLLSPQAEGAENPCAVNSPSINIISSASDCSYVYWGAGDLEVQAEVTLAPSANPAVEVTGVVNQLNNFGTLAGPDYAAGITNINVINNGIVNQYVGSIATISNIGTIGPFTSDAIDNRGFIDSIANVGQIIGDSNGIVNAPTGTINYISNNFLIQGTNHTGVVNFGTINFLSNNPGGSIVGNEWIDPSVLSPEFPRDYGASIRNLGGTIDVLENKSNIGFDPFSWSPTISYLGIYNTGRIGLLSNNSVAGNPTATIVASEFAVFNQGGTIDLITNSAYSTISAFTAISNESDDSNQARIGYLENLGTIKGNSFHGSYAIRNSGQIDSLVNRDPGIMRASSAIFNDALGSISALSNSGSIEGFYESGVDNLGTITTLENTFRITGPTAGIYNQGAIQTLSNTGKIGSDETVWAFSNYGIFNRGGTIHTITNSTSASSIAGSGSGILNGVQISGSVTSAVGHIANLSNQGLILGNTNYGIDNLGRIDSIHNLINAGIQSNLDASGRSGIFNHRSFYPPASADLFASGSIGTIHNEGTITGHVAGIENEGDITSIENAISGRIEGSSGIRNYEAAVETGTIKASITLLKNSGEILGTNTFGAPGDAGIYNRGTIDVIENSTVGIIAAPLNGVYNNTDGVLGAIDNAGTIASSNLTGSGWAALYNAGTVSYLVNRSSGYVGDLNSIASPALASILNINGGQITALDNYGKNGDSTSGRISMYGIRNDDSGMPRNQIGVLQNFGSIDGETGIYNGIDAQIETLYNASGARISGSVGYAIYNSGAIGTLRNQGALTGTNIAIYNNSAGTIDLLENRSQAIGATRALENWGVIS